MKIVLVFSTSLGKVATEMMAGIREFAQRCKWNVQHIEFDGTPFPIRDLLKLWSPIGCIVEASGNGVKPDTIPKHAFGNIPVVYIGGDTNITPKNATCVIHDAVATGNMSAKELMVLGFEHFAFVGLKDRAWSLRRKEAFAAALKINGKTLYTAEIRANYLDGNQLRNWLNKLPKPCGILAANDTIAEKILSICRMSGISIPDDVAVIGVDDCEGICTHTVPTLSSIHPDFRQGGWCAATLLDRKINDPDNVPATTVFSVSGVIHRGSTRRFKRRDDCVSHALERIWGENGVHLSPKDIVAEFPCSRRSAEMRFRAATGHSILDELQSARMQLAKQLLSTTYLPISAVAEQCGYRSLAHFRNAFHDTTGANPLSWRTLSRNHTT